MSSQYLYHRQIHQEVMIQKLKIKVSTFTLSSLTEEAAFSLREKYNGENFQATMCL